MTIKRTVVPKRERLSEAQFHAKVVAGLARVAGQIGAGTLADNMGRSTRQLGNVMGGSTPDAKALFDALHADATVLDELLAEYGFKLCPLHATAANDIATMTGLCDVASEMGRALSDDGVRNHRETLKVADKVRPHMQALAAIVREADELRGAA